MWDLLPLNVRLFLQSMYGETKPVTEKDLFNSEIESLRQIGNKRYIDGPKNARTNEIARAYVNNYNAATPAMLREVDKAATRELPKTRKQISYLDYSPNPDGTNWKDAAYKTLSDPRFRLATALGSFQMEDKGDHYLAKDTYQWNGDFKEDGVDRLSSLNDIFGPGNENFRNRIVKRPTLLLNALAEIFAPQTQRPIEIKVNK